MADEVRDILANLISTHRSYMTDPAWLTHIELAELMIQALDIEGFVITRGGDNEQGATRDDA